MSTLESRINDAIAYFLKKNNLKKLDRNAMAKYCDVSVAAIGQWINGKTLSLDSLKNAKAAQYLGVNPYWLAGDIKFTMLDIQINQKTIDPLLMTNEQSIDDMEMSKIEFWDDSTPLDDDEFEVPYYKDIELTGGCGSFEQYDDGRRKIKYGKSAARQSGASQTQSICMTLVGDSMEDMIRAGSMIAVDLGKKEIREGKIYAFRHGQLLRVKYLIPRPDGGLIVRSHNPNYKDEYISSEEVEGDIKIIGWVWNWSVLERW